MPDPESPSPDPRGLGPTPPSSKKWRYFHKEKFGPAFWTVASVVSMIVNLILILLLLFLGQQLFTLKSIVQGPGAGWIVYQLPDDG
jgi:hypothetical protein